MSLTQALSSALSGLQVNQAGIALVAANVANADTPGYTRKVMDQVATGTSTSIGVRVSDIQREIDLYIQRQLRIENSGASYADTRARMYSQLQEIYGQPGSDTSLEGVYNSFTTALQVLSTSPDDPGARTGVINSAQLLAQQLNQLSSSIQSQRANAELAISDAVNKANEAMRQIASLNQQIAASTPGDAATAALLDNRDAYIDQLSQLMDINVISGDRGQVTIFTNSGTQLVGSQAAQLSFDAVGTMTPQSQWNANPALRGVGTITLIPPAGTPVDLIQNRAIRSGAIAAYLQMRDQDLVQAQTQLDALAASMAQALSNKAIPSTAVSPAPQAGFDIDTADLLAGNTITINYTDTATTTAHTITLVRVEDPSALPLSNTATATANDTVFGIDFSGGMASVITQINTALTGTGMTASNPGGTTLEILDDGLANTVNVRGCDRDIAGRWQCGVSAVYRRCGGLHGSHHRDGVAAHRTGCSYCRQSAGCCRLLQSHRLSGRHSGGRRHATKFHLPAGHRSGAGLLADDRSWHGHGAIHRLDPDLSAAIHQPAGRGRKLCRQSQTRPGSCSEFAAAALQRCLGRQCRRRDGEPADVAEFLCRQRARGLGGKGHVRRADADVRTA
jgi:flagellar hook-associated protein 1